MPVPDRTRQPQKDDRMPVSSFDVPVPPDDPRLSDLVGSTVPDSFKVVDSSNGGTVVMEFRSGNNTDVAMPTVPLGITVFATNLSLNGGYVRSSNFLTGVSGWNIGYNGDAEFNNIVARGQLIAANITQADGGDLLNNGGGAPVDFNGSLSAQNKVTNPNFEVDTSGWPGDANTTVVRTTTAGQFRNGVAGAKLTAIAAGAISIGSGIGAAQYAVTIGRTYTATIWVKAITGLHSARLIIEWYTAADALISSTTGANVTTATTGFQSLLVSGTAPATASYCKLKGEVLAALIGEVQVFDDAALWDQTAWTNLGWSFTGLTQLYLIYDASAALALYAVPTDVTGLWYIESPAILPFVANKPYRASYQVRPDAVGANQYCGQAQLVFNKSGVPETDGALSSWAANPLLWTPIDNFQTGGDGIATAVSPTTLNVRFGHPFAPVNILSAINVTLKDFQLRSTGQATGHLNPVGVVNGIQGVTYPIANLTGTTAAATDSHAASFPWALSNILFNGQPGGYSDTTRNRLIQITYTGFFLDAATAATVSQVQVKYSLDGGITYVTPQTISGNVYDTVVGGAVRMPYAISFWFFCPAGIDPLIDVVCQHSLGLFSTTLNSQLMNVLILPA